VIYKAHVVNNDCDIPASGILGKDFLKAFRSNIDYDDMILTLRTDNGAITFNIIDGPTSNKISIPPRCEVIRHFNVSYKVSMKEDQVLNATEVAPGVMLAPQESIHKSN
jgi:hypothetical protein